MKDHWEIFKQKLYFVRAVARVAASLFIVTTLLVSISYSQTQTPKTRNKSMGQRSSPSPEKGLLVARTEYVGDQSCAKCHQEMVESYHKTAHFLTSQTSNAKSVAGTFDSGANTMITMNPNLWFRMDAKGTDFFQTAVYGPKPGDDNLPPSVRTRTEKFDLVIGSGGKGQTYLFWKENELYQLPIGYSTVLRKWINGPGYTDGTANFERGIIPRCLECHATYFESEIPGPEFNLYKKNNFTLGISCERCHGPGRMHVQSESAKVPGQTATEIVNPTKLTPARKEEVCAQCHGGQGVRELLPAFSFIPGQPLEKYIDLGKTESAADVDVHGKQGKLLMKSKCFQAAGDMTCSTCHNVHKPEPDLAAMSQHCLTCHKLESVATQFPTHVKTGEGIAKDCVSCHMPTLESKVVSLDVDGKKVRPRFRSHWIRVYSEAERQ